MEEVDKDPEEAPEPSVLTENQEAKNGGSTQEADGDPGVEVSEEVRGGLSQEEEQSEKITPQRITNLQRDLTTSVTNIQTAADARESMRRMELEEARKIRLERLENDAKSSQEKFEEITRGWSMAKEKVIPQELQEALNSQQQLCALLLEDKKKLINDLQQELKVADDRYVKDLRKQAEELDLMMERMEDQIKTLTKTYREELAQIERVYQQENEVLLTKGKTRWEQHMKELWDKEQEWMAQRRKKVAEYEEITRCKMMEIFDNHNFVQIEESAKFQVLERERQQIKASNMMVKLKQIKQKSEVQGNLMNMAQVRQRVISLQKERKKLRAKDTNHTKQSETTRQNLLKDFRSNIGQYQSLQKKVKHFEVADVRKFEEMWLTVEAEVKQLVEKALVTDSLICKQHLGIAWERPPMAFMEVSGPIQPQKQAGRPTSQPISQLLPTGQALQRSQGMTDNSDGPQLEAGAEGTDVSMETLQKVMELVCDEAAFLIEDTLRPLASLEKEEQTLVKLSSLLCSLGIEEEDVPKLALFLLKYKQQQTEDVCGQPGESSDQAEAAETSSTFHLTSDLIHPNHVLPALKSFLKLHMRSRESSGRQQTGFQAEARDSSEDEAYWDSMANVISEGKVKLWETAENTLKQYLSVLTEISDLVPETESLRRQNTELRTLLQQSLNSKVGTELETP